MTNDSIDTVKFMSQHLVSLVVWVRRRGEAMNCESVCSGFVMELHNGNFVWVTAGHCLKELDHSVNAGHITIVGGGFMDSFGCEATSSELVPYTYEFGDAFYIDEPNECLDFAILKLNSLQLLAFAKNGITPIRIENWDHPLSWSDFDLFKLLGLPQGEFTVRGSEIIARPVMFTVERIEMKDLPDPPPDAHSPSENWFIGQIPDQAVRELQTIKGMSGGPVFGFRRSTSTYHVVALQSRWWKPHTIFACTLQHFMAALRELMERNTLETREGEVGEKGQP